MTFVLSVLLMAASPPGIVYEAVGRHPAWRLTIRDSGIRLALGRSPAGGGGHVYPKVLARHAGASRGWEAGEGVAVIDVEARPGRCRAGGSIYKDTVRVRLSGRELNGCGGGRLSGKQIR